MPSSTVENYLKAIHSLGDKLDEGALVSIGKVAEHLGLTPGTATTMMKHLEQAGFVDYSPRRGVSFTAEGRTAARQVLRRHRLIELFLVEVMGLDWSQVHEEAEVLEHAFSDRLIARIDEMLGHPTYDPHGDPIPNADGVMPSQEITCLATCQPGTWRLVRVTREDPETLRWLQDRALVPGARLRLISHESAAGILTVEAKRGTPHFPISRSLAEALWVE